MVDVGRRRLPHHREDDEVDEHQRHRQRERPQRARAPIPCTSRADRAGRGSRTARGSGTDRRRRPPRDCTGSVGAHRVRPSSAALGFPVDATRVRHAPGRERIVAIAAAPIAFFVLRALLRSALGSRLRCGADRRALARPPDADVRRRRDLLRLRSPASRAAIAGRRDRSDVRAARDRRRLRAPLRRRARSTTSST